MRRPLLFSFTVAIVCAALAGCSSDDANDPAGSGGPSGACASDSRKDVYTAGLTKDAGPLKVRLVEATPGPMIKGTNAMILEVLDASDQPVDTTVDVIKPWMPDHGHGSAVKPSVTALGGGRYEVKDVYLAMAGLWQITVTVEVPGGAGVQEAMFSFCLDG